MATKRRGALAVVGLAAVLLPACGGGGSSAGKIAVRWRQAMEQGHYETAWDLEGPNMHERDGKAAGIAFRKEQRAGQPLTPERAATSITAVKTDRPVPDPDYPGGVWVYLQVQTKDAAQSHLESVGLARLAGDWRVQRSERFVPRVGWVP